MYVFADRTSTPNPCSYVPFQNPADEPAAAAEASAAAEETDVKPTVAVAETAEEGTTDEAAVTSEADADTAAEADGEAVPADSVEATKAEGGKAPGSPASVGGGEDGPPSKKAKVMTGEVTKEFDEIYCRLVVRFVAHGVQTAGSTRVTT